MTDNNRKFGYYSTTEIIQICLVLDQNLFNKVNPQKASNSFNLLETNLITKSDK
jgi:hypothetical protein